MVTLCDHFVGYAVIKFIRARAFFKGKLEHPDSLKIFASYVVTKLFEIMRDRIQGKQAASDPAPGTFADGYEGQKVLDAIRLSAAERRWVDIE